MSGNTTLRELRCYGNENLETIDGLGDCRALTYLDCEDCSITDISAVDNMNNINLIWARNNNLRYLTVTNKSNLQTLRVSGNTEMTSLTCNNNNLTSLDVSGCSALASLKCNDNPFLEEITGLVDCRELVNIYCHSCNLSSLDVSAMTKLRILNCGANDLTSLPIQGCSKLVNLYIYQNHITGSAMSMLIASLPNRNNMNPGTIFALHSTNEGNTMTDAQATGAQNKNWNTMRFDGRNWVDYEILVVGDVDGDGTLTIGDVADLIDLVMSGNASADNYPAADVDGDGLITIADVSDLVDML